jgi:adenylate cyclase
MRSIPQSVSRFTDNLTFRITLPEDTENIRIRKVVFLFTTIAGTVATIIWATILIFLKLNILGGFMAFVSLSLILNLVFVLNTRHFTHFITITMVIALLVPLIVQTMLGGFAKSGFVALWSIMAIMGALNILNRRQAVWWLLAYIALLLIAGLLEPLVSQLSPGIPDIVRTIIFVWDGVIISTIIFLGFRYLLNELDVARVRADDLLLNILPKDIAEILKVESRTIADQYDSASVLFADIVGFTPLTAQMSPTGMVLLLNEIYSHFDSLVERYGVEKIRTIGDNYMVASGVPRPREDHAQPLAHMALDMQDYITQLPPHDGHTLNFRIGINSGSLVAGVIGSKKFSYDVWGDAVNIASRMESHSEPGKIQISQDTYDLLENQFVCQPRGSVMIKGKGQMDTWFLVGRK